MYNKTNMWRQHFRRLCLAVAIFSVLLSSLTFLFPGIAEAKGESYKWIDKNHIQGTGGAYNGTVTFTKILTNNQFIDSIQFDTPYIQLKGSECKKVIISLTTTYKTPDSGHLGWKQERDEQTTCNGLKAYELLDNNIKIGDTSNSKKEPAANTQNNDANIDQNNDGIIDDKDKEIAETIAQDQGKKDNSCEARGGGMAWLMCPVITATDGAINWVDSRVTELLDIDSNYYSNNEIKASAAAIRNIAYIILIPVMLVMVVGTALGFDFISAYTVKRALPRLVIAAIFITVAYPVCVFLIELFNAVGRGVLGLFTFPFVEASQKLYGTDITQISLSTLLGGSLFTSIFAAPIFAAGILILLIFFGGTLLLFAAIAFLVLMLRQMFIVALLLIAPLAILAWIFPGNDKLWKSWWGSFSKLLIMFPLIMGLIAVGRIFAYIIDSSNPAGLDGTILQPLMTITAYMLPYAFIPFTFRFAGGLFATVAGFANDKSKGLFDRQKQHRAAKWERTGGRRMLQARANLARNLEQRGSGGNAMKRFAARNAARRIGGYNIEAAMSAKTAQVSKEINDIIATGKDDDVRGLTAAYAYDYAKKNGWEAAVSAGLAQEKDGKRQFKSLGGAFVDEANVLNGRRRWGNDTFAQQAALSYEMRKAMTDEQVAGISQNYKALTESWGMTDNQAGGAWIGAAFENQGQHLEFKHTNWEDGSLKATAFANEVYEKKGSYQLSQMIAHTIEQLKAAYDTGDEETKRKVQGIAETFMSRMGPGGSRQVSMEGDQPILATDPAAAASVTGAASGMRKPMTPAQYADQQVYQTSSQGAAHVAEVVRDFAVHVGVYRPLSPTTEIHSAGGDGLHPRQN
jgi:hypothetical protein